MTNEERTIAYNKIEELMRSTYLLKDKGIIKILCASIVSHYLPIDPIWLLIVAGSGAGKTELINAVSQVKDIHQVSSLTSKTFISGMRRSDKDPSLLTQIKNGIIAFKDFTTILNLHEEERRDIMGQLREIYDGAFSKRFGTGDIIEWKGKISLIAGVTTAIHTMRERYAQMGERMIMYSPVQADRLDITMKSLENSTIIAGRREEIKKAFSEYLNEITDNIPASLEIDKDFQLEIATLAEFATRARSPVERDWRSQKQTIRFVHPPEMPTRVANQLVGLAKAFTIMNGGQLSGLDKDILYKTAFDSITETKRMTLKELSRYETVTSSGLAVKLNYPTETARIWLEDLNALGICARIKSGNADEWKLYPQYKEIILKYENIEQLKESLVEPNSMEAIYEKAAAQENNKSPEIKSAPSQDFIELTVG